MPTEKEMLAATIKATAKMFKKNADVQRIQKQMDVEAAREIAQEAASTSGVTAPEAET